MSVVISGWKTQMLRLHFLPTHPEKTQHFNLSQSPFPFLKTTTSSICSLRLHHHYHHHQQQRHVSLSLGASLLTEDSDLEETHEGWSRGADWGQQDEVSDEEMVAGEGFSVPPEGARLFVGNLPFDVGSEELTRVFGQAGVVEMAEVVYNRDTDRSRGFGFVSMRTVEEANKAVNMLNGYDLNGRLLTVNQASRRGSQPVRPGGGFASNRRIFVGNLPWQVDDAHLEKVFGEHGKVVEARVVYENDTGRSRGFGFVKMSTDKEVTDAIAALDGKSLEGRLIRVSVAEERPRRSF